MSDDPAFLFALSARSGSFDEGRLTLNEVPLVVYFSDRPKRIVGHISVAKFIGLWDEGPDSFVADPPNGVLSVLAGREEKAAVDETVIEIYRPRPAKRAVTFDVRILSGKVPVSFGAASLFIDEVINGGAWTGT